MTFEAFTENHVLKYVRRCESPASTDLMGIQLHLHSTDDNSNLVFDMIGQSTSKCYTEEVKGKVTEVEIGYSSQTGVQVLAFSTYTGQVSTGSTALAT